MVSGTRIFEVYPHADTRRCNVYRRLDLRRILWAWYPYHQLSAHCARTTGEARLQVLKSTTADHVTRGVSAALIVSFSTSHFTDRTYLRLGWEMITGFLPYPSESHRKQRKWTYSTFGDKKSMQKHDTMQRRETCVLLLSLMDSPVNYVTHIKRYVPCTQATQLS